MILFRTNWICLLAVILLFAVVSVFGHPNHSLSRRDVDSDLSDTFRFKIDKETDVSELHRVARHLSEDVKTDLKQFFSEKNLLSIAQKFIKIALKASETITGYVTSKSVKEAIQILGFPGADAIATFVEEVMKVLNELVAQVSKSDFIAGIPTKENFWKMLSDYLLLGLKKGLYLNAILLKGAKKAFAESENTKYDVFDNIELKSQFAKHTLETVHKFSGQILKGVEKLTNKDPIEKITGFVKKSSLPYAQEISEILGVIMTEINSVTKILIKTNFIKEAPSMKNVNKFIIETLKATVLQSLDGVDKILKIILTTVQKENGQKVDVSIAEIPVIKLEVGIAIEGINKILHFITNLDMDLILNLMHKFVSVTAKFVLDITYDEGVRNIPNVIKIIGDHLTEAGADIASFFIDNSRMLALLATESKFVKEEPSWENAQEFFHSAIIDGLHLAVETTNRVRIYFDSWTAENTEVPKILKDILRALIPESALSSVQDTIKTIARLLGALTGPAPSSVLKGVIQASQLPFASELADIIQSAMNWGQGLAQILLQSKFLTEPATTDNAILAFIEIFKTGISSGLKLVGHTLEVLESLF